MTDNTGNSLDEADSSNETNARATVTGAEPGRLVAMTMAGSGALAVQQLVRTNWLDLDVCEQQLCAVLCVDGRQVPNGASNEPIKTMAPAARWKMPLSIVSAYHKYCVLL